MQTTYYTSYPDIKYVQPNRKTALETGNMMRLKSYSSSSETLESSTRFIYDNKHFAPLATFTFLGKTSRNTLLRKTVISYVANGFPSTTEYDYTKYEYTNQYDQQGRRND